MKVLVTGGAGFIGSFLVDCLVKDGHEVRIFDNLDPQVHVSGKKPSYLNSNAEFIEGDVRNGAALSHAMEGIEIIFHQAAAVGVGQSQYQIKHYVDVNIGGTANLLDILANRTHRVQKLIVAASMSSYGEGLYECRSCGTLRPAIRDQAQLAERRWELECPHCQKILTPSRIPESQQRQCQSIYAITKMDQEEMVLNFGKTYGLPTVALRYFNVLGPRQSLSNPYTGVAAIFMSRIKNGNSPMVYEDGRQTRDFVSVHDIVTANMLAMKKDEANFEAFNVGTGQGLAIIEIAQILARLYKSTVQPEVTYQFRKGDIRHCISDISKIQSRLGFFPKISFEKGMQELIHYADQTEARDLFDEATRELQSRGLA